MIKNKSKHQKSIQGSMYHVRNITGENWLENQENECQVQLHVVEKFNAAISHRTIQHFVQNGTAGESPKKHGPSGRIFAEDFKILLMAYECYIKRKQIIAETVESNCSHYSKCINITMNIETSTDWLLCKLQVSSNTDLRVGLVNPDE